MLLGAGADPWSVNRKGQTPSEVNMAYNGNPHIQDLLLEAVEMRRGISTGKCSAPGVRGLRGHG